MKKTKDSWEALPKCSACRALMKKKMFNVAGFQVKGWQCPKCREILYMGDDLNKVFVFNKLKKGMPVKVGSLGNSLVMRIPREISSAVDITEGKEVLFRIKNNEILIEV